MPLPSRQVAFPYLYNNRPRKVRLGVYHHPQVMYIKVSRGWAWRRVGAGPAIRASTPVAVTGGHWASAAHAAHGLLPPHPLAPCAARTPPPCT